MKHPKFERRHYKAIANVISQAASYDGEATCQLDMVIQNFVDLFRADNPSFQPVRFRDACNGAPRYEITTAGKEALLKVPA